MSTTIKLYPPDSELPYEPDPAQVLQEFHPNYSTQWLLTRILAQMAGVAGSGSVISGPNADNAVSTGNPVFVGALAIDPAAQPTYTVGDRAAFHTDLHGNLLVNDRKKTRTDDAISADPKQYTTVSSATPVTADGTVLTLAAGEKGVIQNLDDAAVYVKLGATASSSSFNFVLPAGSAANDGTSPPYQIDDYIGVVSIAAATGSPRVSAYKLS